MDLKRNYQKLLTRVLSGEDEDQECVRCASLGRWLAENDVGAADIARVHAAAVDKHISGRPCDARALALLRSSRVLAEVMLWRGLAGCLLRHRQSAEAELRDLGRAGASAGSPANEVRPPSSHPLAEASTFLERVAVTDPLTGIYNARHFNIALEAQIKSAATSNELVSLVMLDVDGLNRCNEAFGRRHGDEALATLARLLMENTRGNDFVARCGGDEFAIILPNCTTRQALVLAERLRRVVEEHELPEGLTASIGVATFPTDAVTDRELINVTQQACYLAQRLGGNTVCAALVAEVESASREAVA